MTVHDTTVRLLARDYPALKKKSFARSMLALMILDCRRTARQYPDLLAYSAQLTGDDGPIDWGSDSWHEEFPWSVRPDAFFLDFNCQMVVAFEVEDHHPVDMRKLGVYWDFYYVFLDPLGWGLALISVDRWGMRRAIPFFDYVFPQATTGTAYEVEILAHLRDVPAIEHRFAVRACAPFPEWNAAEMFADIEDARRDTNHAFWQSARAQKAYETICRHGRV